MTKKEKKPLAGILVGSNGTAVVWPPVKCPRCHRLVSFIVWARDRPRCLTCVDETTDSIDEVAS